MKKFLSISLFLLVSLTGFTITPVQERLKERKVATKTVSLKEFVDLSRSELIKKFGRKLTWKENIGLLFMKRVLKKGYKEGFFIGI